MDNITVTTGMTPLELIPEIIKLNSQIDHILFVAYNPRGRKSLKEGSTERLLSHNSALSLIEMPINSYWRETMLLKEQECLARGESFAFASRVRALRGLVIQHIPMMDFECKKSAQNLQDIDNFLRTIGQKRGAILDSGRSYHYYGFEILSQDLWEIFMAKCLLFDHTDFHYVGHRLLDRYALLRVSASKKCPEVPRVVSVLQ